MRKVKKRKKKTTKKKRSTKNKNIVFAGYTTRGIPVFAEKSFLEKVEKVKAVFKKHGYRNIGYTDEFISGYKGKHKAMDGRYEVTYFFKTGTLILTDWKTYRDRVRSRVPISRLNSALTQIEKSLIRR